MRNGLWYILTYFLTPGREADCSTFSFHYLELNKLHADYRERGSVHKGHSGAKDIRYGERREGMGRNGRRY